MFLSPSNTMFSASFIISALSLGSVESNADETICIALLKGERTFGSDETKSITAVLMSEIALQSASKTILVNSS